MSDSGQTTEDRLLDHQIDVRSDIIIKGQHNSEPSATAKFLDAVQPRVIITTSRPFSENERVKDEWVQMVTARGIKLFRQDETGAIRLRFWEDRWEVVPYLTPDIFRATNR
jgi:beta-lactamase superfamily II metal-dependent hydrolase